MIEFVGTVPVQIQPADKLLHKYQLTLREFRGAGVEHESATRSAFQTLLAELARRRKWQLIPEHPYKLAPGAIVKPDATLRDDFSINRGYWEAKDTHDDLDTEIRAKTARGYPESNIIYDDTARAILAPAACPIQVAGTQAEALLARLLSLPAQRPDKDLA